MTTVKHVEYWRWRYRNVTPGVIGQTATHLAVQQASNDGLGERIEGRGQLGESDDDSGPSNPCGRGWSSI